MVEPVYSFARRSFFTAVSRENHLGQFTGLDLDEEQRQGPKLAEIFKREEWLGAEAQPCDATCHVFDGDEVPLGNIRLRERGVVQGNLEDVEGFGVELAEQQVQLHTIERLCLLLLGTGNRGPVFF